MSRFIGDTFEKLGVLVNGVSLSFVQLPPDLALFSGGFGNKRTKMKTNLKQAVCYTLAYKNSQGLTQESLWQANLLAGSNGNPV